MRLFRRHKHTWEVKAVQRYTRMEKYMWESEWTEHGEETIVRYVCSTCQDDKKRTVLGSFTVAQAKELFPKP